MLPGGVEACVLRAVYEKLLRRDQGEETLRIECKGNAAAMLGATKNTKGPSDTDGLRLQVKLVAGARNRRYLQLWNGAA